MLELVPDCDDIDVLGKVLTGWIGSRRGLLLVRVQGYLPIDLVDLLSHWNILGWMSDLEIGFDIRVFAGVTKWWAINMAWLGKKLSLLLHLCQT